MKIITYNFYCRPGQVFLDSQIARARKFPDAFKKYEDKNGPIDVIMFQELFHNKAYKIMKKNLRKMGFAYKVGRTDNWFYLNGGSAIFSRHPFTDKGKISFKRAHIFNKPTLKGMNYGVINIAGKNYHICNTHLDSFESDIRKTQMKKMVEYINCKTASSPNDIVIIGGDMNIVMDSNEMENVTEVFTGYKTASQYLSGNESYSWSSYVGNDYIIRRGSIKEKSEWLDFFICKNAAKMSPMKIIHFKAEHKAAAVAFGTSFYLNAYDITDMQKMDDLSDHYAVVMEVC